MELRDEKAKPWNTSDVSGRAFAGKRAPARSAGPKPQAISVDEA